MSAGDVLSVGAALASAVCGAFAAVAAFRSAGSAQKAQASADEAERRSILRQAILIAKEVELEALRNISYATLTARSYHGLAIFTGGLGGDRHRLAKDSLEEKSKRAERIGGEAKVFGAWPSALESAPLDEIDRVLTKLQALRIEIVGMRSDFEAERADVERQCDLFRSKAILGGSGQ